LVEKTDLDVKCIEAFDGQEALDILQLESKHPDIIFLDINMPRMNGYEFLEAYNNKYAATHNNTSVIIIVTSSLLKSDKEKCEQYNFVKGFVDKPLDLELFKEIIALHK
jgi:CheY-like chemotaxis protein